MPHISKDKLIKKDSEEIYTTLVEVLLSSAKKGEGRNILSELLTETEQVMLAKRCAAIALIAEGIPLYRIWNMLKLSSSTVRRLYLQYDQGIYPNLEKYFSNKKKRIDFWKALEIILRGGLPEQGKNRWKWLDDIYGK